jgi:tetratricopeptide (TPR) repeat protein
MKLAQLAFQFLLAVCLLAGSGCAHANAARAQRFRPAAKKAAAPSQKQTNGIPALNERQLEERIETLAHYAAGLTYDLNDKSDEALEEYWKVITADPSNEQLALELARRFIRDQKPERAIDVLEKAAALPKASGTVHAWLGLAYAQVGKTTEAIKANKTALKKQPNYLPAYQNLSQLYIQTGQTNQAFALLKQAAGQKEADADFLLGISDSWLRYNRQQLISDQQLLPVLVPLLDRVAEMNPDSPLAIQKLAETYLAAGELKKAEPFFSQLLQRYPDLPGLRERLAGLYVKTGNKEKASEMFEAMRKSRPTDPQAYILLGSLAYENQEFQKAAEFYETALKLNPNFEPLYYDLAGIYLILKKPEQGLKLLDQARLIFHLNFTLEFYTGVIKSALKNYQEALGHFTSAELLAKNSDTNKLTSSFYYQLGSAFERSGNIPDAEKSFRRALQLNPNSSEVLNYLAYMWAERGENLEEAFSMMQKALKQEPENEAFLDSMAWVLFKQKKYKEALPWMEKAISHSSEQDATLFDHLGEIYLGLGQSEKAREAFEKSLKIEPSEAVQKKLDRAKSR